MDALFLIGQAYNEIKDFYNAIISLGKSQTLASYYKANNQSHNVYLFFDFEICSNLSNTIINTYTQQIISHQTDNIDYNILLLKEIKKILLIIMTYSTI